MFFWERQIAVILCSSLLGVMPVFPLQLGGFDSKTFAEHVWHVTVGSRRVLILYKAEGLRGNFLPLENSKLSFRDDSPTSSAVLRHS